MIGVTPLNSRRAGSDMEGERRREAILARALRSHGLWLTLAYVTLLLLVARGQV